MDQREKAVKLKAQGFSNYGIAKQLGVNRGTVWRWLNPERAKEYARRDNKKRRPQKREWDNARNRTEAGRGRCSQCDGLLGIGAHGRYKHCRYCRGAEHDRRGSALERLWAAGKIGTEIQRELGWSRNQLAKEMFDYRAQGYDLPYRKADWRRKAAA